MLNDNKLSDLEETFFSESGDEGCVTVIVFLDSINVEL